MQSVSLWEKHVSTIVRLASRNVIYKKENHYCIKMKDNVLELEDCPTLIDVYLHVYDKHQELIKEIEDLYRANWDTSWIINLVRHPKKHIKKLQNLYDQVLDELEELNDRPIVDEDDFLRCPRRTGLLVLMVIETDIKNLE